MGSHRVGHDWSDLAVAAGFPGGSGVKNLLGKLEMQVPSLDQEEPLEKEIATHSSILAWRIQWTEEPGGPRSTGLHRIRHD